MPLLFVRAFYTMSIYYDLVVECSFSNLFKCPKHTYKCMDFFFNCQEDQSINKMKYIWMSI